MLIKKLIFFNTILKLCFCQSIYYLAEELYKHFKESSIKFINCPQINYNDLSFRGKPTNLVHIIDINKVNPSQYNGSKIDKYKYVYLPDIRRNNDYVNLFSTSTIFVTMDSIEEKMYKKDYCYFIIYLGPIKDNPFYYLIIDKYNLRLLNINILLIMIAIPTFVITVLIYFRICCCSIFNILLQYYIFTRRILLLSIPLAISSTFIEYVLALSVFHSLFKSYIFTNLLFLLNGFSIVYFEIKKGLFLICFLIFFAIDYIFNLIFEYIIFYLPSINNLHLFTLKDIIEHVTLFLFAIKAYTDQYRCLILQYEFEKSFITINIFGPIYKYKINIYRKVMIYSFIYSFIFIIYQFIKIIYISHYVNGFYLDYFINVCIELVFALLLVIFFFPVNKIGIFSYLPVLFDYNSKKYITKITSDKEEDLSISKLTKNILINEYKKNNLVLVFINPFSKSNEIKDNVYIGKIENNNIY